jgi:hypothetical protein
LIVLPDLSHTKIETSDTNENILACLFLNSDDTMRLLNGTQDDGGVGDISSETERETNAQSSRSNVHDRNDDMHADDEANSVGNLNNPGEQNPLRGNAGNDSSKSLQRPVQAPSTSEPSRNEFPCRCDEMKSNTDDSIDEWVSELLEHFPLEE